jgi:hypothetical protein
MTAVPSVIEYSIDGGRAWFHGRTIEAWVTAHKATLSNQRAIVRGFARQELGAVEAITTRVLAADDPRGVLNQPPAARTWTHGQVLRAVSDGTSLVTDDPQLGACERETDLVSMAGRAIMAILADPSVTLDTVMDTDYAGGAAHVRTWWDGWR